MRSGKWRSLRLRQHGSMSEIRTAQLTNECSDIQKHHQAGFFPLDWNWQRNSSIHSCSREIPLPSPRVPMCTHTYTHAHSHVQGDDKQREKKRKHLRKQIWAAEHVSSCSNSNVVHTKWQPSISYWRIHLTLRWWDDKRETEESLGVLCGQFLPNETTQAFQVLAVQFDVVVSGSFHPQWLHGFGAALVQGQAMGKIYHLVLCPMDDQHWRRDFRHFLNAETGTHKWTQCFRRNTTPSIHREKK